MTAPAVAVESVTDCAVVNVPGVGDSVGVATVPVMVQVPEATPESTQSVLVAMALSVRVVSSGMFRAPV